MPSLFVPHGGGPAFFMQGSLHKVFQPMADFLASIDRILPSEPSTILLITAHWETPLVTFTGGNRPNLIYDYFGFPKDMYNLTYPASGNPEVARRAAELLGSARIDCNIDPEYGWDHGVFIPLKVIYPNANIPIVAMSLEETLDPNLHVSIGHALTPLRDEGVLILGSGMSYHNLHQILGDGNGSVEFDQWLDNALAGDHAHRKASLNRWNSAPSARKAHPREEHLLPLMVASGAGSDEPAIKLWEGAADKTRLSAWAFN